MPKPNEGIAAMAIGTRKAALHHVDRLFSQGNVAALSDPVLLDRFLAAGDHDAFAALVSRHGPKVLGTCRQILGDSGLADDAFQDVFLTLARRARTIQGRRSLEGWLHRVSVRIACRAWSEANRRRDRERRHDRSDVVLSRDHAATQEVNQAVHAELERLPERYRRPVVLCLMEGRTQPEAAVALQVSEGAIRGRLARARALLRSRLARRGLAPAIGSLAIGGLDAAVPARLLESTLGAISRQAVISSSPIPAKVVAAVLIAALGLSAASFGTAAPPPAEPPLAVGQAAPEPKITGEKPVPDGPKIVFRGRVLNSHNQPAENPRFYLVTDAWANAVERKDVKIEPDGSYRLEVAESAFWKNFNGGISVPQVRASLTVTSPGFGQDWVDIEPGQKPGGKPGQPPIAFIKNDYVHDFHLPADRAISGRILDVEGKPVAGASVQVGSLSDLIGGEWGPVLAELRRGDANAIYAYGKPERWRSPTNWASPGLIPWVTTDADGRFRLVGAGGDRLVQLDISGPAIRDTKLMVLNREGVDDVARIIRDKYPYKPNLIGHVVAMGERPDTAVRLFGSTFTAEVDPARTVSGTVTDAVTGKPIEGAYLGVRSDAPLGGSGQMNSDAQGHYHGVRWDGASKVLVSASFYGVSPYLPAAYRFEDAGKIDEIVADFRLKKGVRITGKVLEAGTNRPIVSNPRDECGRPGALQAGFVLYRPLSTNEALKGTPEALYLETYEPPYGRESIGGDGSFQITVPPGPGVLLIEAQPGLPMTASWGGPMSEGEGIHKLFPYPKLKARAKDDGAPPSPDGDPAMLPDFGKPFSVTAYNAYKVINPAADAETLNVEFELRRGASRLVKFVDPEGKPISGLSVFGLVPDAFAPTILDKSTEAEVLTMDGHREVLAVTKDGRFVARETIAFDPNPATIRMEPSPTIVGRVVDAHGKPLVDYAVGVLYFDPADPDPANFQHWKSRKIPRPQGEYVTDAEGKFRINGLIPGLHFQVGFYEVRRPPNFPNGTEARHEPPSLKDLVMKPGESRDLGQIMVSPDKK